MGVIYSVSAYISYGFIVCSSKLIKNFSFCLEVGKLSAIIAAGGV